MKQIQIIGNIGTDATSRIFEDKTLINFSVATNRKLKDGTETTDWFSVTTEQKTLFDYLKKGTKVFVQGNFKLDTYTDKNNKVIPTITIYPNVGEIQLLSKAESSNE